MAETKRKNSVERIILWSAVAIALIFIIFRETKISHLKDELNSTTQEISSKESEITVLNDSLDVSNQTIQSLTKKILQLEAIIKEELGIDDSTLQALLNIPIDELSKELFPNKKQPKFNQKSNKNYAGNNNSANKKLLDNLQLKEQKLQLLQKLVSKKDSVNQALDFELLVSKHRVDYRPAAEKGKLLPMYHIMMPFSEATVHEKVVDYFASRGFKHNPNLPFLVFEDVEIPEFNNFPVNIKFRITEVGKNNTQVRTSFKFIDGTYITPKEKNLHENAITLVKKVMKK